MPVHAPRRGASEDAPMAHRHWQRPSIHPSHCPSTTFLTHRSRRGKHTEKSIQSRKVDSALIHHYLMSPFSLFHMIQFAC